MITKPTIFIIGAGASVPYNIPANRQMITDLVDSQPHDLLRLARVNIDDWEDIRYALLRSRESSLDYFATQHQQHAPKIQSVIAAWIASKEDERNLINFGAYDASQQQRAPKRDDWLRALVSRMKAPSLNAFLDNRVHFVTFNYDRLLEDTLSAVIGGYIGHDTLRAATVLAETKWIHHVYGTALLPQHVPPHFKLGDWERASKLGHQWGASIRLARASSEITVPAPRDLATTSWQYACLGFSFADENIDILARSLFEPSTGTAQWLKATALGLGQIDRKRVKDRLRPYFTGNSEEQIQLYSDTDCLQLFENELET